MIDSRFFNELVATGKMCRTKRAWKRDLKGVSRLLVPDLSADSPLFFRDSPHCFRRQLPLHLSTSLPPPHLKPVKDL